MRQRYLLLFSLLACVPAQAITFQTRLEQAEWKVEGDQFECRLSQAITDFGVGEFVRRAGEQAIFRLQARERWLGAGSATLLAAAAPWQPGRGDINLGMVNVAAGEVPFNSTQLQAGRLLAGLLDGRSPLVRHRTLQGGETLEVRLLPVRFAKAYNDYMGCTAKLLPVNFDQVRQVQLGFPSGGTDLDDRARARLEIILQYMRADPSVNRIELDGHSDNSGSRLTNRDLSRRRALAVQGYFEASGVPAERIVVRFHGEQYPLVTNSNAANRAKNRRVTVRLSRVPEPEPAGAESTAEPASAPAAAGPASS
ncbi:flagellar protein MotY [Zestomonas carbonaria]|uniref:Peptidoglycan-associated lipoprotein n=1 Tax=Zestomonas carbonaria TaxID=2762745 RepID=A0A7U7EQ96_9GAMM|nr:OmpA family protein [Pseudomonas carbonaria]CAD5109178.1 Peptidoglycan-associated lipoprotein [Pseudomonas carbonaria]